MGVIVRCLVLKQPDCISLMVEASRSIYARDGPAILKSVRTRQWLYAERVLCVVCVPL